MNIIKADIIAQLQKEILLLQGIKRTLNPAALQVLPGIINNSFPNAEFPLGAVHEFSYARPEDAASTGGFVAGILASLLHNDGTCVWISACRSIFPPALKFFGITPENIIFIDLKREKDILWVMEEALKCNGLAAVVGEMQEISFTASRRLQLAVEQSRLTGFILCNNPRSVNTTACAARWRITPLASKLTDDMPGVGFPRWKVELLKVRNGKPGSWQIEFAEERFRHVPEITAIIQQLQKKAG